MTIIKERLAQFGTMELLKGSHDDGRNPHSTYWTG